MTYRFALERLDYSDFATGRVLHSAPGRTAFPVRLADEVFQRCLALLPDAGKPRRIVLYDPVCGSAALLATLAFLHGSRIARVIGSDIDSEALRLAERNLALLTPEGLDERIETIAALREQFGKESHAEALASARRLRATLVEPPVISRVFQADATDPAELLKGFLKSLRPGTGYDPHPNPLPEGEGIQHAVSRLVGETSSRGGAGFPPLPTGEGEGEGRLLSPLERPPLVDVVIADVPYGLRSFWSDDPKSSDPDSLWRFLEALRPVLSSSSVVTIASNKSQRPRHEAYVRRDRFQVGKRRIELLTPRGAG